MYFIDAHEQENSSYFNDVSIGGNYTLLSNSSTEAIISFSPTINFIDCLLQSL